MSRLAHLIDAALEPFAPGMVLRRRAARSRLEQAAHLDVARQRAISMAFRNLGFAGPGGFDAARTNRLNKDQITHTLSGDMATLPDRQLLADRAGHAIRNDGWAKSVSNNYRKRLSRITPRAAARDPRSGELLESVNDQLDRLWSRWACRPHLVDREARKTFAGFQDLQAAEYVRAGEAFVVTGYTPRLHSVGLWLQAVEPEQLALDMVETPDARREVRDGIEVDEAGRVLAYWVYAGPHPLEALRARREAVRVPAARVIHFHRQDRVRQTHGVSLLATALKRLHNIAKYDEAELVAMWMEACQGLIDKGEIDDSDLDLGYEASGEGASSTTGSESPEGTREEVVFQPGMIARGNFEAFKPQHPTPQGVDFIRMQLRGIAAAAGLDYANVANDYNGTYSARRQGMVEEYASIDYLQELVVDTGVGRRVWDQFVFLAVMEGRIEGLDLARFVEDPMAYTEAEWAPPARPWIDPAKEATAAKIELESRLVTRTQLLNTKGRSFRDTTQRIAEERAFAERHGVAFPEDGGASASRTAPPDEDRRRDDDDEEDDDKAEAALELAMAGGER